MLFIGCYRSALLISMTTVILSAEAFIDHIKFGVSVGTRSGASMAPCMVPEKQILSNLYVDYFQSDGPCLTPEGAHVYTFKNSVHAGDTSAYTYGTVCSKLPKICHLLRQPGKGRSLVSVGQNVVDSFKRNMNFLYDLLTGRSATTETESHFTSRVGAGSFPKVAPNLDVDCTGGSCVSFGIGVCDVEEDVAFPVVGKSAITNASVTILQDFPDRVQPIFYRKCKSYKPQVIYGRCIQEYLPVSVYVTPLYSDAVLSQDFVMVESGCHVIADISYQEWRSPERQDQPPPEPRDQNSKENNQTSTEQSVGLLTESQLEQNLEKALPLPSTRKGDVYPQESVRRRVSDRLIL